MSRHLPPLNPLSVFEVVARTRNLTAAASELHVTQSAVSQQIAVLENYLGAELFTRERHGVALTPKGKIYAEQIVPAFEAISAATSALMATSMQGALRIRTYTTFAGKWLVPRLHDFKRRYPDIEVKISTATPEVDFNRDAVDVAIQFGDGDWPSFQADLLFLDEIEPVCSPKYLKEVGFDPAHPERLLQHRLLESHYRRTDWSDWLSGTGLSEWAMSAERMTFNTSLLTWQAAVDGLGIAMGQNALLTLELDAGQLVRPFNRPVQRNKGHFLVRPKVQRESRKVMVFRDWLLESVRPVQEA